MENKRRRRRRVAEEVKRESRKREKKAEKRSIPTEQLLPTGCALFNLALSDNVNGGFQKGKMANIIGDSSSGKTFLCLSALAEAAQLERFDNYALILDDTEEAAEFDLEYLFGEETAERIQPPRYDEDGEPLHSSTIQEFWDNITDWLEKGQPFIYALDSFDGLDAEEDQKKVKEQKEARRKGNQVTGSYGMAKAKVASSLFKDIIQKLKNGESILLIISQTRDNINPASFTKKTRSGGKALKFYATHEVWLAAAGSIKSKEVEIGQKVKAKVSKNKLTGKRRIVDFPIYYDYGVDSLQSAIKFLVDVGHWEKKKQTIHSGVFEPMTLAKLIEYVEDNDQEEVVWSELQKAWDEREESLRLCRKKKYRK